MEDEVLRCIDSLLSPIDHQKSLERMYILRKQAGYAVALTKIAIHSQISPQQRQLASIMLKSFIESNWMNSSDERVQQERLSQIKKEKNEYLSQEDGEEEEEEVIEAEKVFIIIDEQEKRELRNLLPQGLSIEERSIQINLSVCLGVVAKYDYPAQFPNLISSLKELILSNNTPNITKYGALVTLEIIIKSDILSDEVLEAEFTSTNQFFLELYASTSSPELKKFCSAIMYSLVYWVFIRKENKDTENNGIFSFYLEKLLYFYR